MAAESKLSELMNGDRVRSSVRRLFQNDITEILSELFQNSQRASASKVEIFTSKDSFIYRDNGHGLLDGVNGFHTLLKIAESNFDNETIEAQDPIGLGIHALLAHESIGCVTFASGNYGLTLDTKRWWTDNDYYTNWFKELEELKEPISGFQVEVNGDAKLITTLKESLAPTYRYHRNRPAEGYENYLEITLDGERVNTSLPQWALIESPIIETTYQGSRLLIGFDNIYGCQNSSVNWYGQVIGVDFYSCFKFHLDVQAGRPVNPLSPTRRGLIKDEAQRMLVGFVKDEIFRFVFGLKNRSLIKAEYVNACFMMDRERALRESPYIVVSEILPLENPSSLEDLDRAGEIELFTYAEAPFLLETSVNIVNDAGKTIQNEHGISSFVSMIGRCYRLEYGDTERLNIKTLWWKPGKKLNDNNRDFFHERGEWGIGTTHTPPTEWKPVDKESVFSFTESSNWEADLVDWTVGTNDIIGFLRNEAWAGFDPDNDDCDYEDMRDSYEKSIEHLMRAVIGNCIPYLFSVYDLKNFLPTKESRIEFVCYHYKDDNHAMPEAVKAFNDCGESILLKLL